MDIQMYIIPFDASILETMRLINTNGKGIAYICKRMRLKGVVTDGDIRRHILKDGNLDLPINLIANRSPKVLFKDDNIDTHVFMQENNITSVPILNEEKEIVSIDFLYGKKAYFFDEVEIPVVIMAGGKGTRLHPYTEILPKPLIPIGTKTITERILDSFKSFGSNEFYMIVNYKKEFIKAYFADKKNQYNIQFIEENTFMGTGGGLKLIEDKLETDFVLSNCDILVDIDISDVYKFHKKNKNLVTIVGVTKKMVIPYGVLKSEGEKILIQEKPEYTFMTNSGIYILHPHIFDYINEGAFIHITDIIKKCTDAGEKIGIYPISEKSWMDMGQLDELEKMRERFSNEK
ncbi:NTP transferase domain-containing protein [[Clostridium] innocuum]|uniref:sugar phosphate nucleotidyltransferase n=1 Tax=Clostridium innocuum TaxID=1522 RepID=UPI001EDEBBD1|nr:sugar phosphate nucleotidyltransferase [[Clostridium] innocuum]MCG4662742.1 NTP transferase domain-containing protein [[Clostridium] innocuum]MCR0332737.1 NTP transferase domain-containing protein [[Clostridium] innocuum]